MRGGLRTSPEQRSVSPAAWWCAHPQWAAARGTLSYGENSKAERVLGPVQQAARPPAAGCDRPYCSDRPRAATAGEPNTPPQSGGRASMRTLLPLSPHRAHGDPHGIEDEQTKPHRRPTTTGAVVEYRAAPIWHELSGSTAQPQSRPPPTPPTPNPPRPLSAAAGESGTPSLRPCRRRGLARGAGVARPCHRRGGTRAYGHLASALLAALTISALSLRISRPRGRGGRPLGFGNRGRS